MCQFCTFSIYYYYYFFNLYRKPDLQKPHWHSTGQQHTLSPACTQPGSAGRRAGKRVGGGCGAWKERQWVKGEDGHRPEWLSTKRTRWRWKNQLKNSQGGREQWVPIIFKKAFIRSYKAKKEAEGTTSFFVISVSKEPNLIKPFESVGFYEQHTAPQGHVSYLSWNSLNHLLYVPTSLHCPQSPDSWPRLSVLGRQLKVGPSPQPFSSSGEEMQSLVHSVTLCTELAPQVPLLFTAFLYLQKADQNSIPQQATDRQPHHTSAGTSHCALCMLHTAVWFPKWLRVSVHYLGVM